MLLFYYYFVILLPYIQQKSSVKHSTNDNILQQTSMPSIGRKIFRRSRTFVQQFEWQKETRWSRLNFSFILNPASFALQVNRVGWQMVQVKYVVQIIEEFLTSIIAWLLGDVFRFLPYVRFGNFPLHLTSVKKIWNHP